MVRELVGAGMRVSIDTFDAGEIRTAVAAGAELGAERQRLEPRGGGRPAPAAGARVVALPDLGGPLDTLEPTLEALDGRGRARS